MALTKLVADLNIHQSKPDKVRGQATATKEYFDKAPNDIKTYINDTLAPEIDILNTAQINALATHKSSDDHDGRYYTEAEMDVALNLKANDNEVVHLALDETISGEKTFSKSPVAPTPTSSGQVSTKGYVDTVLADAVLGAIPDNSLTNSKLAPEIKISSLYTATNTGNNYSITPNPAISAYSDGITLKIKVNADSTGNATLNVNLLGIKNILKANGINATSLKANGVYTVVYSSGNFILQGEGASGNATASDLLSGKTASTDAGDITGAMSNNGAVAITPGISNQAIPAGYHNGSGYVVGDTDLIASNILNTANIFGVQGSAIAGKRFASGTATSSATQQPFRYADDSYTIYFNAITVSGLSFKPAQIIIICRNSPTTMVVYHEHGLTSTKEMIFTNITSTQTNTNVFSFKGDAGSAYCIVGGFCMPTGPVLNVVVDWYAYE